MVIDSNWHWEDFVRRTSISQLNIFLFLYVSVSVCVSVSVLLLCPCGWCLHWQIQLRFSNDTGPYAVSIFMRAFDRHIFYYYFFVTVAFIYCTNRTVERRHRRQSSYFVMEPVTKVTSHIAIQYSIKVAAHATVFKVLFLLIEMQQSCHSKDRSFGEANRATRSVTSSTWTARPYARYRPLIWRGLSTVNR